MNKYTKYKGIRVRGWNSRQIVLFRMGEEVICMENKREKCPCCGYLTLKRRNHPQMPEWEVCVLCNWEDDGQSDQDAGRVYGGANSSYSMTEARLNFKKYLVMYSPDNDTRMTHGDCPEEIAIKKLLIKLFKDSTIITGRCKKDEIWSEIIRLENQLHEYTHLQIEQYELSLKYWLPYNTSTFKSNGWAWLLCGC